MTTSDPLALFLPPVREWFRTTLGEPTPPQRHGWPAIAAGQHTLILAPTGSGKTLAAFLACLDHLWRQGLSTTPGVRVLYISPLNALNNDIHRNLQLPLEGVPETAARLGVALPTLTAAIRTGETPTSDRQKFLRSPAPILITTPESLHLLLTSRARQHLRGLTHVIIDEIHSLCANKRGVFLALLLERLEHLQRERSFVRIGLSATQRPLDEVARYLGGLAPTGSGFCHRPVQIVDGGLRKDLDLGILNPVERFGPLPESSVWPYIHRRLVEQIKEHQSTIVFANDRRTVERLTACINQEEEGLTRAHHGSVSRDKRLEVEAMLKEGRLRAVCASATLEMGIDMGAVDLVCQVASPGSVARGLQRVGRAGHIVGKQSKGRFIPRTQSDLLEQAVLMREMIAGRVEEIRVPQNCLDVLAQQLVAMVAMDDWKVPDLYALVRRAYPYHHLSPQGFETTLEMISGRYRFQLEPAGSSDETPGMSGRSLESLQPRISWDRVNNRLTALPGSQKLVVVNGGVIPDTGMYSACLADGTRIGELDEEFIYEQRVGNTFVLGTNAWRLDRIDNDRVIVSPAEGQPASLPFWRGEGVGRSFDLGRAIGVFLREIQERLMQTDCLPWLQSEFKLDGNAAGSLYQHISRQLVAAGAIPTDRTLIIEASRDQLGDWQVLLLSPYGRRLHLGLRLALEAKLRARLGYQPQCIHHDDGIVFRLTDSEEPVLDLLEGVQPDEVETLVLDELADSALFALRFRQNATRSLLMPRGNSGQRTPLWLQRLRGRDLLQVARRHADFPVVVETFRECLHDHLDLPRLQELLADIRAGRIQVVTRRADVPCPFAAGLLFSFTAAFMYQYDEVEKDGTSARGLDRDLLSQIVAPESQDHLLDPRAVHQVEKRLRGVGRPPRSPAEMAEWLRRLGDLTLAELEGPMAEFLTTLQADGRAVRLELPGVQEPTRWIAGEELALYQRAFSLIEAPADEVQSAACTIFARFLDTHALVGLEDVLKRYPFDRRWATRQLEAWVRVGRAVSVQRQGETQRFAAPTNLDQVQRGSLGLLRREIVTCQPAQFADFVLRWQYAHPATRQKEPAGLAGTLSRLQGLPLPLSQWEQIVLPIRVVGYQARWLDEWATGGTGTWVSQGRGDCEPLLAFLPREMLSQLDLPPSEEAVVASAPADLIASLLEQRGASFLTDLALTSQLTPSEVRRALWELVRQGRVTNDRFDVARRGEQPDPLSGDSPRGRPASLKAMRRLATQTPEGRWSLLPWGRPGPETTALAQVSLLLGNYGVAARELALLNPWLLPWRVLYEVLSRLEMAGEVRRGYFVEGLSGAQFALPEAVEQLQEQHAPTTATAPLVLLHSQDPANLYGSSAPFDIELLDGGTRKFVRRAGNYVVLKAGKPVLLAEQHGKKLSTLPSASKEDVRAAAASLPGMFDQQKDLTVRHTILVEEWNGKPVGTSEGRELLEAAGFVRDYRGMALYAVWR